MNKCKLCGSFEDVRVRDCAYTKNGVIEKGMMVCYKCCHRVPCSDCREKYVSACAKETRGNLRGVRKFMRFGCIHHLHKEKNGLVISPIGMLKQNGGKIQVFRASSCCYCGYTKLEENSLATTEESQDLIRADDFALYDVFGNEIQKTPEVINTLITTGTLPPFSKNGEKHTEFRNLVNKFKALVVK